MATNHHHCLRFGFIMVGFAAVGLVLLDACSRNPDQKTLREVDEMIDRGQLDRAYGQLEELYQREPKLREAREMQIVIQLKRNQVEDAIEKYKNLSHLSPLVTFLNETIRDDDPIVRANVCVLIIRTKPSNAVYLLSKLTRDPNLDVRRAALQSLSQFSGKKVRQTLEAALMDHKWQARADAVTSLEKLGDPLASQRLFQNMLDTDSYVRLKTRHALETLISDSNLAVYQRALKNGSHQVRTAAAIALAVRHNGDGISVLYEALSDHDPAVRVAAARALANLDDRSARPLLRESLHDPNSDVRATAAIALAELGDVVSTNNLAMLAQQDPVDAVRLAAAQAFRLLSPPPSPMAGMAPH